jgi:hypothetical protein
MKKKKTIHQIYLSLYLANLLFFFLIFVSYLLSLSVSLIFSKLFKKKKSFLVAPLSTLRNFCTVVLCLQYFVSFLKKQREKSYIWSIVYFWSLIYLWVPSPTSSRRQKKFGNILSQNILEKIIYYKRLYVVEFWSTVQNGLGLPDI